MDTEVTMYDEKKDFHEVFELAHESSRNSTGVDEREFPDKETVHKKSTKVKWSLSETKQMVLLCRQFSPAQLGWLEVPSLPCVEVT